jgi:acyl-coenzyme A thioesterase PaaI-like protein
VTIEIRVAFINPGRGTVYCQAWPTHSTASLVFLEGAVREATGLLVARGSATFKRRAKPIDP